MFDYRALGDPVNTASRLESVNKLIGTNICVSEATLAGCPNALVRPIGRLVLKGKSEAIKVFEPLTPESEKRDAPLEKYLACYHQMIDEGGTLASQMFDDLATTYPADPLVHLHRSRMAKGAQGDLIIMEEK